MLKYLLFSHPSCYQLCRGDVEGGVPNLGKQNLGKNLGKKSGRQNLGENLGKQNLGKNLGKKSGRQNLGENLGNRIWGKIWEKIWGTGGKAAELLTAMLF